MTMIECPECGQKLSKSAVTCTSCGRQQSWPAAAPLRWMAAALAVVAIAFWIWLQLSAK